MRVEVSATAADLMSMMGITVIHMGTDGSSKVHEVSDNPFTITPVGDED